VEDQAIINRVRSGETEAFSQLIRQHQQMAFAVAMSVVKQEADARDAVQQAFLQAFTGLASFKGNAAFSTWLCRIVINEALRIVRRSHKSKEAEWSGDVPDASMAVNEALANLQREDRARVIRQVFARMPPKEALVLHLFYLEDYSVKETAYCTSLTTNHVKVLLSRGRNRFYALCQHLPGQTTISEIL
jgi:RNA polymerase sigma-70 factor (ECF subfamily)